MTRGGRFWLRATNYGLRATGYGLRAPGVTARKSATKICISNYEALFEGMWQSKHCGAPSLGPCLCRSPCHSALWAKFAVVAYWEVRPSLLIKRHLIHLLVFPKSWQSVKVIIWAMRFSVFKIFHSMNGINTRKWDCISLPTRWTYLEISSVLCEYFCEEKHVCDSWGGY